jgi:hypothetical protein
MRASWCFVLLFCFSSVGYSQDASDPDSVLASFNAYLASIQNASFSSRFKDRVSEESDAFTNMLTQDWKVDLAGRRLWRRTRETARDSRGDFGNALVSVHNETLLTPSKQHSISADPDTSVAGSFTAFLEPADDYWDKQAGFLYLSYPLGYFRDGGQYQYIPDLVQNTFITSHGTMVSLSCQTDEYNLEIRLDSAKGWMPQKFEYTRIKSSMDPKRPDSFLYEVDSSSSHDGIWFADSYHCRTKNPSGERSLPPGLKVVDGKLTIVPADTELGSSAIKQPAQTLIAEVSISDLRFNSLSESDFRLQATIPNGLAVHMQDARHLKFAWLDGEIVPVTDPALLALRKAQFRGGIGSPRLWLVVGNLLLLFSVVCFTVYRRYKRSLSS